MSTRRHREGDRMGRTFIVAALAALAAGFVGTAGADAPATLDERVLANEQHVAEIEGRLDELERSSGEVDTRIAPALNLARCIRAAEGVRTMWTTIRGRRVRIIIDQVDDKVGLKGVEWLALVHPSCLSDKPPRRRVPEIKEAP